MKALENLMTTKQVAEQLGTSPKVILENAKKCIPNKKIVNGKPTLWSEIEVTVLLEYIKRNSNRTDTTFTTVVKAEKVKTNLTNALKLDLLHKQIEAILQEENELLKHQNAQLQAENEILQIALDESKDWYSIKRMEKLNPTKHFSWRLLKKESEKLEQEIKKVFDANYGEVNAYHISVWQSLYFDSLNYGD